MKGNNWREIGLYGLFGLLTTLVNFGVFWAAEWVLRSYLVSNAVAWVAAVAFAYVVNKLFVFQSKSWKMALITREILEFIGARVTSFLLEELGLWLLVDLARWGSIQAKVVLAVMVIVLNYFFSKFVIFRK